ncbi:hypothetical protein, conserved [Leishmania tarentolae]|uniref:Uncharacterized protein n=1 Tax=Leishmania tarentolae TaxID=5689 RepID=A0A640KAZ3_LEITA|nr:hypothetical protein, conserved [Leishmania tarentolae]
MRHCVSPAAEGSHIMSGVRTEGPPVKKEADRELSENMAPASVVVADSLSYSMDLHRDLDAIEIADIGIQESCITGAGDHEVLISIADVLRSGEEMPPCLSAPYMEALFNTDPRISFDALHIGCLRAMEEREKMSRPQYDYLSWSVPPTDFVEHPANKGLPFFTVPLMHPVVRTRSPRDRGDRQVDELLSNLTKESLNAVIGDDMLEHLRFSRNVGVMRRRRSKRASAAGGKV